MSAPDVETSATTRTTRTSAPPAITRTTYGRHESRDSSPAAGLSINGADADTARPPAAASSVSSPWGSFVAERPSSTGSLYGAAEPSQQPPYSLPLPRDAVSGSAVAVDDVNRLPRSAFSGSAVAVDDVNRLPRSAFSGSDVAVGDVSSQIESSSVGVSYVGVGGTRSKTNDDVNPGSGGAIRVEHPLQESRADGGRGERAHFFHGDADGYDGDVGDDGEDDDDYKDDDDPVAKLREVVNSINRLTEAHDTTYTAVPAQRGRCALSYFSPLNKRDPLGLRAFLMIGLMSSAC
jgi:hypothetical protein